MRRTLLMIMAVALLLTQCRKPAVELPTAEPANTVSMTITAGPGGKTDISETGGITWSTGDRIYVGDGEKYIGFLTLVGDGGSATGTFTGSVTLTDASDGEKTFHFFYLGSTERTLAVGATTVDVDFSSQEIHADANNKLENASKHHVGYGSAKGTVSGGIVTGINVTMVSKVALARFSFTEAAGKGAYTDPLTLSGTGIYNKMTVDFASGTGFSFSGTEGAIRLRGSHSERYVMLVPAGTGSKTLNFGGGATGYTTLENGIEANKFYGRESAIPVPLVAQKTVNFGTPNLNWSVCNLGATNGATKESWYGDYYAWGATETWYSAGGQTSSPTWKEGYSDGYTWAHCPFTNGTYSGTNTNVFTKYVPQSKASTYGYNGFYDNKTTLEPSDDAAAANWGDGWRMPTEAEWQALYNNNTFEWLAAGATSKKVTSFTAVAAGYLVVKGKDLSLDPTVYMFLPAADCYIGIGLEYFPGASGWYWSSSLDTSRVWPAKFLRFFSTYVTACDYFNRNRGYTVRPVRAAL